MRKLVTWLVVTLGIAALVRKLRRRAEPEPATSPSDNLSQDVVAEEPSPAAEQAGEPSDTTPVPEAEPAGDPAAELRERLARSRAEMPSSSSEESVEERRSAVHEEGRAALDEMRPHDEPAGEPSDEAQ
jgi:hypothetical protein